MADQTSVAPKVSKEIIYPGEGDIPRYENGSKATFHFKVYKKTTKGRKLLDCSKTLGQPFELLIGKKFKLEIWEEMIKTMRINEVARFTCDKEIVRGYHFVSKNFRNAVKQSKGEHSKDHDHHHHEHSCSLSAVNPTGYADLDKLARKPRDLIFEMELMSVDNPGQYEKETWQMDPSEKLSVIPKLKQEGNELYAKKEYEAAADKYAKALGLLEQLSLREKPGDDEWVQLDKMKIPLLLNYSQCKLLLGDYYEVIRHTSTVLEKDNDNVKAIYRRAKAHKACWNPDEAKNDFKRAAELDESLKKAVKKELDELEQMIKEQNNDDKDKLKKLFSSRCV
ncbi:AH receptor-interacting protein-like [Actinia tenebrosa]|uniref:AH receptor-interacting protein-like n=1 Tax=Actinia tenebrosa TaxID=6105 RepID=A0A6P8HIH7_ACTTE|nr:AH receptor-interacting protein-like [Actinia tenebrosa]